MTTASNAKSEHRKERFISGKPYAKFEPYKKFIPRKFSLLKYFDWAKTVAKYGIGSLKYIQLTLTLITCIYQYGIGLFFLWFHHVFLAMD